VRKGALLGSGGCAFPGGGRVALWRDEQLTFTVNTQTNSVTLVTVRCAVLAGVACVGGDG
jgi:hypothetical protein